MAALVEAIQSGKVPDAEVALILSDQADAAGLVIATDYGIETSVIERLGRSRNEHLSLIHI